MTGKGLPFVAALAVLLTTAVCARADHLRGVLAPVEERRHEVTLTLHRGYAVWEAERSFVSEGAGQAIVHLALPATGDDFRVASSVPVGLSLGGAEGWRPGKLEGARAAELQFRLGGGRDEAAALLATGIGRDEATLRIAGMHPGIERRVRYRLLIPVNYDNGRYRLRLTEPVVANPGVTVAQLEQIDGWEPISAMPPVIRPHGVGGRLAVDGQPWPEGEAIALRPGLEISLEPKARAEDWKIDGGLAVVPFGDRFLTHARIEISPRLSEPPRDARVVVVVDASRSIPAEVANGLRATARAYLGHLPDARVEVVAFDRQPRPRFGRFVPAAVASRDLAHWTPPRRNGSEIGQALALAATLLAAEPDEAPKRLVVFTDGLTRQDLAVVRLDHHLEVPGLVAHVVEAHATADEPRLSRAEGGVWDALVEPTGGLAWHATVAASADDSRAEIARMAVRLVRPIRLTGLDATTAPFGSTSALCAPFQMSEGQGASLLALLDEPLPWLRVGGKLWRDDVAATLPVVDREAAVWAALAFGTDVLPFDETRARRQLAQRSGAVTDLTSYVVGRTSQAPPPERGGTARFGRLRGVSTGCRMGHGHAVSSEGHRWLQDALREALYTCGGMRQSATVRLETTGAEVVKVGAISVSDGATASLARCLERATWSLELPAKIFGGRSVVQWQLDVRPIFE